MLIYLVFIIYLFSLIHILVLDSNCFSLNKISLGWNLMMFFVYFIIFNMKNFFFWENFIMELFKNYPMINFYSDLISMGSMSLSVDNFSLVFIILSSFLINLSHLISINSIKMLKKEFYILLNLTNMLLLGVFISMDLFLFYMFFEILLIPIFLIIIIWGESNQSFSASFYFFIYTVMGSLFMLLSILKMFLEMGTTSFMFLKTVIMEHQKIFFLLFFFSFSVKMPLFPLHMWLPQAHVEAPLPGSILLAGILLKLGGYGLMSFSQTLFTEGFLNFSFLILVLSMFSSMYGSIITIKQTDLKSLMAYSSVSHMGVSVMGMFSLTIEGWIGSIFLMVAHGCMSSGMFILATTLYDSFHSSLISIYKGLIMGIPVTSFFFFIFTLSNMSVPGTLNFWGEYLIFFSLIKSFTGIKIIFFLLGIMVLSSYYSMNLFNKLFLGVFKINIFYLSDLSKNEFFSLLVVMMPVFYWGVVPEKFLFLVLIDLIKLISISS